MFSIITLTFNKLNYTRKCMESVLATTGADYEVIAVDNGSTDGTQDYLRQAAADFAKKGMELRTILNMANVGSPAGRNQAMKVARGEHFVFMDNDVMVKDADWLVKLRAAMDADAKTAIAGPKIIYPFPPHLIQCAGVAISRTGRVQFRGRGEPNDAAEFNQPKFVQCLISACFMLKRALYEEIGEMDVDFSPLQFEDFDYCYRARERGHKVLYTPSVEVDHWESVTSEGTPAIANREVMLKNWLKFKRKWQHAFAHEDGPPDSECVWKKIQMPSLEGMRVR